MIFKIVGNRLEQCPIRGSRTTSFRRGGKMAGIAAWLDYERISEPVLLGVFPTLAEAQAATNWEITAEDDYRASKVST